MKPNGLSYLTRLPDDNLSIALEQNFYEMYTKKWNENFIKIKFAKENIRDSNDAFFFLQKLNLHQGSE